MCVSQTDYSQHYALLIPHLIFHLRMAERPCRELISQILVAIVRWFHFPTEEQNRLWAGVWPGKNPLLVYTAEHLEHPTTTPRKQNLGENMSQCYKRHTFNKHTGGQISLSFTNLLP